MPNILDIEIQRCENVVLFTQVLRSFGDCLRLTGHGSAAGPAWARGGGPAGGPEGGAPPAQFVQAFHQLESTDPVDLRTKLPTGGDPIYPLHVRFTGAVVAGNSGSFRDFVGRMVAELHGEGALPLLIECPSAAIVCVDDHVPRASYSMEDLGNTTRLPRSVFCPITQMPMLDPLLAAGGKTRRGLHHLMCDPL